ncbi:MAG TPA: hypothetical protein VEJ18_06190, partial [Planctomycetota bacterium]|nr:hypothetical protein [Planctomycetota bacterium]
MAAVGVAQVQAEQDGTVGTAVRHGGGGRPGETGGGRVVGMPRVAAWRATKDPVCLEAAVAAARALVDGQLESGGWQNHVDF